MISVEALMMVPILDAPPCRLASPFSKFNWATAVIASQHAALYRRVVNTASVTALRAAPVERIISAFCRHHFAAAYGAFVVTRVVSANELIEPKCRYIILHNISALTSLYYLLSVA